jgi:hypothetical protein
MYTCPVCGYAKLKYPAKDFLICPSCGTEFGYQDANKSFEELRFEWIDRGMIWHSRVVRQPVAWSAVAQLAEAGLLPVRPRPVQSVTTGESHFGNDYVLRMIWA